MSGVRRASIALGAAVAVVALAVQLFADGLFGSLAATPSLPAALNGDWPFTLATALSLDRIGAVRRALARGAIVQNQPARALVLLAPLPASPEVIDLRATAEFAAGHPTQALHDFAAVGDYIAARSAIDALAANDPRAALVIVRDFERQLAERTANPEISAEVAWREGGIAAAAAARYPTAAAAYDRAAFDAFARAPNDEKYLLNDAFAALRIGSTPLAHTRYLRAAQVVPNSVDAFVGIAVTAAVLGACTEARAAIDRARAFAADQHRLADPAADGYAPGVLAAFARCAV